MELKYRGPNPLPLRDWDFSLLKIYRPVYTRPLKACCLCALGPCGFTKNNHGKCGIDKEGLKAREVLLTALIGASAHTSLARRLLEDLIARCGSDCSIDVGEGVGIKTPLTTLICGSNPKTLGEMGVILGYVERELTHLLSSVNYGTEASPEDFISKALHTGMLDSLALEVADVAQISALNLPKGASNSPLVDTGLDKVIREKPFILIIGHNSYVGVEIIHLLEERGFKDKVEVGGLCCAASDLSRHHHGVRIIGNQADQLEVISSGIADVIVLDTQCIRADVVDVAKEVGSLVIATTQETALGLKDLTSLSIEEAADIISLEGAGVIFDKKKAGEVVVLSAFKFQGSTPNSKLRTPNSNKGSIRIGRGPVRDSEIRGIAPSIIMGEIPGIVGLFGCPEEDPSDIYKIAQELLKRGYIVATGGCSSIDLAKGGNIFRDHRDSFDACNLINLGSCVSASHLLGACVKIARVVSYRAIEGNYREIADYILNRVGVVLVLWGGFTQKAFATTLGAVRLGIPVLFGQRGRRYGLHLVGRGERSLFDARLGDSIKTPLNPSQLLYSVKDMKEGLALSARFCMRHSDTTEGRKTKLKNYIELYRDAAGEIPQDIQSLIRTEYDIPEDMLDIVKPLLQDWKPGWIPDPTLLSERVRTLKPPLP